MGFRGRASADRRGRDRFQLGTFSLATGGESASLKASTLGAAEPDYFGDVLRHPDLQGQPVHLEGCGHLRLEPSGIGRYIRRSEGGHTQAEMSPHAQPSVLFWILCPFRKVCHVQCLDGSRTDRESAERVQITGARARSAHCSGTAKLVRPLKGARAKAK